MSAQIIALRPAVVPEPPPVAHHTDASTRYPGGKGSPGVAQRIVNLMPPHRVYVEPFVGGGAVLRLKRRAARNVAVDLDTDVVTQWQQSTDIEAVHGCGIEYLRHMASRGDELVYADPPYVRETRASRRAYYAHEMSINDHESLLEVLCSLRCYAMVSGYACALYDQALRGWTRIDYPIVTRGGDTRTESLWMNFEPPVALHDYRYLGQDFRERERIKRKAARWKTNLSAMPALERQAILSALREEWPMSYWGA